jgi:hypothetical protein
MYMCVWYLVSQQKQIWYLLLSSPCSVNSVFRRDRTNSECLKLHPIILLYAPVAGQQAVNRTIQGRRISMEIALVTRQQ